METTIVDSGGATKGVINDQFGNGLGTVASGTVSWSSTRVSGYGPLPGAPVETLTDVARVAETTAWRTHRIDATGFIYLGARYYEPTGGRFLSADPKGHAVSMSLYDYAHGDPVNYFDPDGRDFWSNLAKARQAELDGNTAALDILIDTKFTVKAKPPGVSVDVFGVSVSLESGLTNPRPGYETGHDLVGNTIYSIGTDFDSKTTLSIGYKVGKIDLISYSSTYYDGWSEQDGGLPVTDSFNRKWSFFDRYALGLDHESGGIELGSEIAYEDAEIEISVIGFEVPFFGGAELTAKLPAEKKPKCN